MKILTTEEQYNAICDAILAVPEGAEKDQNPIELLLTNLHDLGLELVKIQICHCGKQAAVETETKDRLEWMNPSLAEGYCIDCAEVRCDAYPGACTGTYEAGV